MTLSREVHYTKMSRRSLLSVAASRRSRIGTPAERKHDRRVLRRVQRKLAYLRSIRLA